jgi:hypothetical protein
METTTWMDALLGVTALLVLLGGVVMLLSGVRDMNR